MRKGPAGRLAGRAVAIVTLGCARNEVDSDDLAARLERDGLRLVADPAEASAVLVNTCGFIEAAKQESIETLLDLAADGTVPGPSVIAVGCLAERYGRDLAEALPEVDAVLGFDDYPAIAGRVRDVLAGARPATHAPRDRRTLLPVTPVERARPASDDAGPGARRRRLGTGPVAPVKLASGCDRRCSFCAIPAFRGAFVSRPPAEVIAELTDLAADGVREAFLVSENTTSYGKDLGDVRTLERVLPAMAGVDGLARVRLSYLQPAEMRPTLVAAIAETAGVAAYFDLSFQHASPRLLRRMRRFGSGEHFLALLDQVRAAAPAAGIRSNVILGFPGETEDDVAELEAFLAEARLDAIGVFGYSAEDGTPAAGFDEQVDQDEVRARVDRVAAMADALVAERALERVGEQVSVLVTQSDAGQVVGLAEHQGPEGDGVSTLLLDGAPTPTVGDLVRARVVGTDGVDLRARMVTTP